jgi:hypothetical protein
MDSLASAGCFLADRHEDGIEFVYLNFVFESKLPI